MRRGIRSYWERFQELSTRCRSDVPPLHPKNPVGTMLLKNSFPTATVHQRKLLGHLAKPPIGLGNNRAVNGLPDDLDRRLSRFPQHGTDGAGAIRLIRTA